MSKTEEKTESDSLVLCFGAKLNTALSLVFRKPVIFLFLITLAVICGTVQSAAAQKLKLIAECLPPDEQVTGKDQNTKKKAEIKSSKESDLKLKLKENVKPVDPQAGSNQLVEFDLILPITCVSYVRVVAGPQMIYQNQSIVVNVTQGPGNLLAMSASTTFSQPYSYSFQTTVALDQDGYGIGPPIYIKPLSLGSVTLTPKGPPDFTNIEPYDVLVTECACPVIEIISPSRN